MNNLWKHFKQIVFVLHSYFKNYQWNQNDDVIC